MSQEKPKKRTIFEILYQRFKKKPVTDEELRQLEKEAYKERLKADIAKSKRVQTNSKQNKLKTINFGGNSSINEEKIAKGLNRAVSTKDVSFYSKTSEKDIRKTLGI